MLDKLQAVADRYEELCARSEQPDFYNDPKKAAAILRERNDLEPIIDTYQQYRNAQRTAYNVGDHIHQFLAAGVVGKDSCV